MKKVIFIALAAMAVMMTISSPGHARGRIGIVIGPGWGPWWGWPYYPYYPNYSPSPVIIQQEPETYIQQPPQEDVPNYWYFCQDPKGYYPYVKKCPKGWLKVVPPSAPSDE